MTKDCMQLMYEKIANNMQGYSLKLKIEFTKTYTVVCEIMCTGADPGIYVRGGALDRQGGWGPPRSPAGPGQCPVGGPGGEAPRKLMRI